MKTSSFLSGGLIAAVFVYGTQTSGRVGKYYTVEDVIKSKRAKKAGLMHDQRAITRGQLNNARRLSRNVLTPVIRFLNSKPLTTSWFRSKALNALIGGAKESTHLQGRAVDQIFYYSGSRRNDLLIRALLATANFDRIILEKGDLLNPRWVHIEVAPSGKKPRGVILYTPDGNNYTQISQPEAMQLFA